MTGPMLTVVIAAALASMVPLMLAAIGETISEQSGVLNIGLEGMLLVGGFFGFVATHETGNFWLGFLCGGVAGAVFGAIMAMLSVRLGGNQIVVGIGITLAGTGLSSMLYDWMFAETRPRLGLAPMWTIYPLSEIPITGSALFVQPGVFYISLALTLLAGAWLTRTAPGLRLRTAGQKPSALDAVGGDVLRIRTFAVLFTGVLAGFGGAYLALISAGTFTPAMTHGLGFLAIVVAMLARGRAWLVLLLSFVYGAFLSVGTALQLISVSIPNDLIMIAPFIAVMIALVGLGRKSTLPPALAVPYVRGKR